VSTRPNEAGREGETTVLSPDTPFGEYAEARGLPPVINIDQLMEFLGVESRNTIYALHQKGMPRFAVGRQMRYRRDRVLAWLEEQKIERPRVAAR
jgi:excisionase family DNA binding protein